MQFDLRIITLEHPFAYLVQQQSHHSQLRMDNDSQPSFNNTQSILDALDNDNSSQTTDSQQWFLNNIIINNQQPLSDTINMSSNHTQQEDQTSSIPQHNTVKQDEYLESSNFDDFSYYLTYQNNKH